MKEVDRSAEFGSVGASSNARENRERGNISFDHHALGEPKRGHAPLNRRRPSNIRASSRSSYRSRQSNEHANVMQPQIYKEQGKPPSHRGHSTRKVPDRMPPIQQPGEVFDKHRSASPYTGRTVSHQATPSIASGGRDQSTHSVRPRIPNLPRNRSKKSPMRHLDYPNATPARLRNPAPYSKPELRLCLTYLQLRRLKRS